jgi:hypothetical protein
MLKVNSILRTERNRFHAYLHRVQMASLPGRNYFALCPLTPCGIRLGYRDLEEMMAERGLHIDHTTIYRSRATLCTRTREARPSPSQGDE